MTVKILIGDCRDRLAELPAESVHCVVTSPPYWALRDYGIPPSVWGGARDCAHEWGHPITKAGIAGGQNQGAKTDNPDGCTYRPVPDSESALCRKCGAWRGCLGLEPTPELFVEHLVQVFRQVWRVLRDDGTLWLNLGDSCAGQNYRGGSIETLSEKQRSNAGTLPFMGTQRKCPPGLKRKDMIGIPWRVAFALQADGWYLRSAIIWHKPNCMPESVRDRPTNDYEFVFLLAKSEQYFYDQDAIREPNKDVSIARGQRRQRLIEQAGTGALGKQRTSLDGGDGYAHAYAGLADGRSGSGMNEDGRNRRAVWTIPTYPYKEAHFATFPPALVEPCVKAGTSERGCCPACGAPWERITDKEFIHQQDCTNLDNTRRRQKPTLTGWDGYPRGTTKVTTTGWRITCDCEAGEPVPCTVLDPFGGAGTVGLVADRLSRDAILVELNADYAEMARRRIADDAPMFTDVVVERK